MLNDDRSIVAGSRTQYGIVVFVLVLGVVVGFLVVIFFFVDLVFIVIIFLIPLLLVANDDLTYNNIVSDPRMVSCGPAMSLPSTLATSEPPSPATSAAQQAVEGASAREDRPAGAEGGFHPGHPPPLGHPRGPGGPPRGVTR